MVREYFKSIGRYATREHGDLCSLQKQFRNAVQNKGAAPPELSERLENAQVRGGFIYLNDIYHVQFFHAILLHLQATFTKLITSLEQLAAMLGEVPLQFSEPEEPPESEGTVQGVSRNTKEIRRHSREIPFSFSFLRNNHVSL